MAEQVVADGSAFECCKQMFAAQGGDICVLEDADDFKKARFCKEIKCCKAGYIYSNNAEMIGSSSVILGAGRIKKEDPVDFSAGIVLHKKAGDRVEVGDVIATFYTDDETRFDSAETMFRAALDIRDEAPALPPLVYARVTAEGVEYF